MNRYETVTITQVRALYGDRFPPLTVQLGDDGKVRLSA